MLYLEWKLLTEPNNYGPSEPTTSPKVYTGYKKLNFHTWKKPAQYESFIFQRKQAVGSLAHTKTSPYRGLRAGSQRVSLSKTNQSFFPPPLSLFWPAVTCVGPFVDLEVFRPREDLATAREGTGKGLLASVHTDVIDQFVFRLERLAFARTLLPEADVVALLRAADVLHRDVGHQLVHGAESFVAALLGVAQLLGVDPLAYELLLDALLPHVAEKGTRVMVMVVVVGRGRCHVHTHVHIHGAVLVVELSRRVRVGPRAGHLAILLRSPEYFARQPKAHLPVEHIL